MPTKSIQFDEKTSDEKWASFKENIFSGLRDLKAEKIVGTDNTIQFRAAFYTAHNFLIYISSGKLFFDDNQRVLTYHLSIYWKLMPGFIFAIAVAALPIFVPSLRHLLVYIFCLGTAFFMFLSNSKSKLSTRERVYHVRPSTEEGNINVPKSPCFRFPNLDSSTIKRDSHPRRILRRQ